ncbi:cobalt ECF transporter T component CbiQ [bacterium]|nr:cobalt ECF transporter T component CbiQ [bacterium]
MIEEKFVSGKSVIHNLDPKTRIMAVLFLSFAAALCDNFFIAVLYFIISIVLIIMAKLNVRDVIDRIKPVFWFLLMIWILLPVTFDGQIIYQFSWLKISGTGIILCCKISIKSITILLFFTTLIATMNIASLGNGLHKLYVPDKLIFLLLMSYRYIAVIEDEYKRLLRAAKFRGFRPKTNLHSYKTFAYLAGMLFVRASLRAQRVHQAMLCRAFNQKFYSLDIYQANRFNLIFLICVLITGLSLLTLEIMWN